MDFYNLPGEDELLSNAIPIIVSIDGKTYKNGYEQD